MTTTHARTARNKSHWKPVVKNKVKALSRESHFAEAVTYFKRVRAKLFKDPAYRFKYIAIRDKKIIDVDADKFALYDRVVGHFPDQRFICMPVWAEFPTVDIG